MPQIIFGEHDEKTIAQLRDVDTRAEKTALMAGGHLGYIMPIGGVAAYREQVSVTGVGFDIACGNAAIRTNLKFDDVQDLGRLADEIQATLSFGVGRNNRDDDAPVDHPLFESAAWDAVPFNARNDLREKARNQLGTVGSGNHYVDIFADEDDTIWVGVHFGSRGFGHTVASGFLALDQGEQWGKRVPEREALLPLDSELGERYWALMELAGEYAYAGREWVARRVVELLGGEELELVHNHHNFAWREEHDGEQFIVIRKGATPAWPGQKSFIGGSMGDDSYIVQAAPEPDDDVRDMQARAMFSTVHGAGRVMSRTAAAGKRRRKTGEVIRPGLVSPEMMHDWLAKKGVILRGGGLDESPHAYRRLDEVLTFASWLFTIARRKIIDRQRASQRVARHIIGRSQISGGASQDDILSDLVRQEQAERLHQVLTKLDVGDQEILALRYWSGLSGQQIAERLGIGSSAARKRLSRAVERLRRVVEPT